MNSNFEIDSLSDFDSDLWSQTMIQLRQNAEQERDIFFFEKSTIYTKNAKTRSREAELHVRYHELKMEIIEFSCRERFEWMKIYSEPNEIEQFMEGFRAKLDEFEKVRFYNYLSENACLEMFMQHESCFSNAIK